jgi:hypothetical protein
VSDEYRVRLATEEDLERDFPEGFLIGFPVGPPADDSPPPAAEQPELPEEEKQP